MTELSELCSGGEFLLLHRLLQDIFTYAFFWLPRVNLSFKNKLPCIILFRFLEKSVCWNQIKFLCDECSVNPYDFFAKATTVFLK